jgi:hypothetical protein
VSVSRGASSDPADGATHLKGASNSVFLASGADPNPVGAPNHKLAAPQSAEHQPTRQKSFEWPHHQNYPYRTRWPKFHAPQTLRHLCQKDRQAMPGPPE